jgi:hypothetical protein
MITLLVATGFVIARAQSFEVASVKVQPVVSCQSCITSIRHDTVTLTIVPLADWVKFAYGLSSDFELWGYPSPPEPGRVMSRDALLAKQQALACATLGSW